ncbi:MAG: thioredoxin [Alistipes sp.]|nr:thioredoxin [Alistipes sp.]
MALTISTDNLESLLQAEQPLVIDFWAEWCGPCRSIGPVVEELATAYEGRVTIGKCDVDENNAVAVKYSIRNIPTILFIKGGEVMDRQVGACSKEALQAKIEKLL